jgi:hypothetical protein
MTPLEAAFTRYGLTYPRRPQKIRCPIGTHEDTHPSATINPTEGLWNCFTCGQGGDAYTLIMLREGVGFREAKQTLDGAVDGDDRQVRGQLDGGMGLLPHRPGDTRRRGPWRTSRLSG